MAEGSSCAEFRFAVVEGWTQQFIRKDAVKAATTAENKTVVGDWVERSSISSVGSRSSSMSSTAAALSSCEFPVALGRTKKWQILILPLHGNNEHSNTPASRIGREKFKKDALNDWKLFLGSSRGRMMLNRNGNAIIVTPAYITLTHSTLQRIYREFTNYVFDRTFWPILPFFRFSSLVVGRRALYGVNNFVHISIP